MEGDSSFSIVRKHGICKCAEYTVAWVCVLGDTELLAARILLDEEHNTPQYNTEYDRNTYICGKIGEHKVVVACLPSGRSGNLNAGHLTGPLFGTFPNIKITLLVGIAGAVPKPELQGLLDDVYLGDVVIGWSEDGSQAVVQYDAGRWKVDGFEQRGSVDQPGWHLTQALTIVKSNHDVGQTNFSRSIARLRGHTRFARRRPEEDKLFAPTYKHEGDYYSECCDCDVSKLVNRPRRAEARPDDLFKFHQGQTSQPPAQVTFNPNDRFRARDLGYFEPDDNASKPVESQDGKTVYHNVFSFTSRLRVKATGNEAATIAKNLDQCLLGKAERWYTEELSDVTRAGLQTGVELWCKELEARFREAPGVALSKLEALRYTVQDVRARKDPEEYVQQIILNGKNAGTATTEAAQVMMAYNHMDVQLRVLLAQPTADATISSFLKYVQAAKPNWFDLYQPFTRNNKEFAGTTRHDRHQVSAGQTRQTPVWIW